MMRRRIAMKSRSCGMLVLGDVGHSPRMQAHALELSRQADCHVYLVGYLESTPREAVLASPDITLVDVSLPFLKTLRKLPRVLFPLYALLRLLLEFFYLLYTFLFTLPRCHFFLLQNPPTLPALPLLCLVAFLRRTRLIVDFHNYGYSLLEIGRRPKPFILVAK